MGFSHSSWGFFVVEETLHPCIVNIVGICIEINVTFGDSDLAKPGIFSYSTYKGRISYLFFLVYFFRLPSKLQCYRLDHSFQLKPVSSFRYLSWKANSRSGDKLSPTAKVAFNAASSQVLSNRGSHSLIKVPSPSSWVGTIPRCLANTPKYASSILNERMFLDAMRNSRTTFLDMM